MILYFYKTPSRAKPPRRGLDLNQLRDRAQRSTSGEINATVYILQSILDARGYPAVGKFKTSRASLASTLQQRSVKPKAQSSVPGIDSQNLTHSQK